ncbi:hypothetical protein P1A145kb_p044 [Pectobacterium phage DU_PP_I]|nr:hypothetical protein P1A145kb_p044 [Pectobacterium phage DU_PP_I]ATS93760.1 hypothetical protein P12B145kb_p044 [Pectobacterium phage DU_PP_IV]
MIKKFVAWIKALFAPAKIEDAKVDEYIAKQSQAQTVSQVRFTKAETRPLDEPLEKNQVLVSANVPENTKRVVTVETRQTVREVPVEKTPPKSLDEQLKGVELPAYAKGKTLPPKAKRQFIKQAKVSGTPARRLDDAPHSTGGHVVSHGIDPVNAALYGYTAATILNDDTPAAQPAPVEECRSSTAPSTFSSGYGSSSSSYDSSSYDSGSSYSS